MLRELAFRLKAATAKIGHLALYDVYERVAKTLLTLGVAGEENGKPIRILEKRPTHQELAAMVGTSRGMGDTCIERARRRRVHPSQRKTCGGHPRAIMGQFSSVSNDWASGERLADGRPHRT